RLNRAGWRCANPNFVRAWLRYFFEGVGFRERLGDAKPGRNIDTRRRRRTRTGYSLEATRRRTVFRAQPSLAGTVVPERPRIRRSATSGLPTTNGRWRSSTPTIQTPYIGLAGRCIYLGKRSLIASSNRAAELSSWTVQIAAQIYRWSSAWMAT